MGTYSSVTLMGMWMGLSHIALALWLMTKGFVERLPSQVPS
jgi:hypothetical protein